MSATHTPAPARRERQARLMRLVNRPMRWALALPFPTPLSRRLMLVTHVGRRSGRIYVQPVSYVRLDGDLLTPGGGRWTRNLGDREPVTLRVAGRVVRARPERLRDRREVERGLRVLLEKNPRLARFIPFLASDGTIDPDRLGRAVDHGFCVVRWHLVEAQR